MAIMRKFITPGELLLEKYLEPRGVSQNAMARAIGVSPRTVNEIVLGKRSITPKMSIRFGAFFGQSDNFWHSIQTECDFRSLEGEKKQLVSSVIASSSSENLRVFEETPSPYMGMAEEGANYDVSKHQVAENGLIYKPPAIFEKDKIRDTKSDFHPRAAGDKAEVGALRSGSTWHEAKAAGERAKAAEYEKVEFKFRVALHKASAVAWEAFASAVKQAKNKTETEAASCMAEAEVWERFGYEDNATECKKNAESWNAVKLQNSAEVAGEKAYVAALNQGKTYAEAKAAEWKAEANEYRKSRYSEKATKRRNLYIFWKTEAIKLKTYIAELQKGKSKKEAEILSWRDEATENEKFMEHSRAAYLRARADMYEQGGSERDIEDAGIEVFFWEVGRESLKGEI